MAEHWLLIPPRQVLNENIRPLKRPAPRRTISPFWPTWWSFFSAYHCAESTNWQPETAELCKRAAHATITPSLRPRTPSPPSRPHTRSVGATTVQFVRVGFRPRDEARETTTSSMYLHRQEVHVTLTTLLTTEAFGRFYHAFTVLSKPHKYIKRPILTRSPISRKTWNRPESHNPRNIDTA